MRLLDLDEAPVHGFARREAVVGGIEIGGDVFHVPAEAAVPQRRDAPLDVLGGTLAVFGDPSSASIPNSFRAAQLPGFCGCQMIAR